ncbi:sulfate ABC transporter substrate-binding protein [Nocardioides sp. KIGAM211]|uniref:Sulfate ABC transporter substrate-binding protein n=2 Tax=Nocardioides luti TaxID=2761101 RepID=A0A7X0RHV3_9ACTN|nr:sulfate ABC transporter substrate-binding protein [Nocardioides luti]
MKMKIKAAAAASVAGVLALTACSASGSGSSENTISVVGYSVLEAANKPVFADFQDTDAGKDVTFKTSYGASGDQSRAVDGGLKADVVHFSLETDVTRLVDSGIVDKTWKDTPTKGIATSSVVVFVVRKGNPDNIQTWDDIVKPGVEIITPNPGSSGSARWNIMAAWAHIVGNGGSEDEGKAYLTKLLDNTIALPSSGRDATTSFTEGNGDVLLSYENEAILAKQSGADVDYVVPPDTLLIENPAAVTKDASASAKDFLDYLTTEPAQEDYAQSGFRPVIDGVKVGEVEGANDPSDPFPTPDKLFTINDDFGGWAEVAPKFFNDGSDGNPLGIVPQLQEDTGKQGEE